MKIRGESGGVPARMGGGAGGVSRGGKVLNRVKANVKDKLENSETAIKIANTKPVVKATKVATKAVYKVTKKSNDAKNRKFIDKFSTNYVANQSVKVRTGTNPSEARRMNKASTASTNDIASGATAKRESAAVKQSKPAKVVKINSAPAKSADAAKKTADAKALKAANKKK